MIIMMKELIYFIIFIVILIALVKFKLLTVEQVEGFLNMIGGIVKMIGRTIIDGIINVMKMV